MKLLGASKGRSRYLCRILLGLGKTYSYYAPYGKSGKLTNPNYSPTSNLTIPGGESIPLILHLRHWASGRDKSSLRVLPTRGRTGIFLNLRTMGLASIFQKTLPPSPGGALHSTPRGALGAHKLCGVSCPQEASDAWRSNAL